MKQYLLQLFFLLFAIQVVIAQQFPVQVIPQTIPPRPVVLSDYANASSVNDKVRVQLILNDLTELNREVRLKLFIEGQGINAQSNDVVVGATPIFLEGGVATTLGTAQLAPYFDLQNLQGISPGVYGNSLPEGSYSFCFEVYDLFTGNVVSGKTCTNFVLFDNDPPLLNLPLNAAGIQEMNPLNIVFQWTPRHINVSNVQYELIVSEIWDLNLDPQAAFLSSPPIFETTTTQTTFIYDGLQPSLIPGKRYGWRVRAFAAAGAEEIGVFTNNGFSEIFYFDYQTQCDEPLFPDVDELTNRSAKLIWQGNFDHLDYTVKYREKDAESEWYDLNTPREYADIDNLNAETTYEYKIQGNCMFGSYGETFIQEFTTLSDEASSYQGCAIEPEPILLENQERLTELFLYDNFTAGKFKVRVLEVENSNSPFKGKGYVTIPWLGFITIAAEFENIELNTDKELISGAVVTTYDPDWGNVLNTDGVFDDVFGNNGDVIQFDASDMVISDVQVSADGAITLIDNENNSVPIVVGTPVVITDSTGNQWLVTNDGEVVELGPAAEGGVVTSENTNGVSSSGSVTAISSQDVVVTFTESGFYAFDPLPAGASSSLASEYNTISQASGGTYDVPYKAISDITGHTTDFLEGNVTFANGKTKSDLIFKTTEGTAIDTTWSGNTVSLSLTKQFEFGKTAILATVKPADSTGNYDVAGTADLWHMSAKTVNVTVVPINGSSTGTASQIQTELNTIYEKVGISFNVDLKNNFEVPANEWDIGPTTGSLDVGDSGVFSNYSAEENAIKNYYKDNHTIEDDEYYMFVFNNIPIVNEDPSKNTQGFMPLKRQYGFVFNNSITTMAHELGHGVFGLEHYTEDGTDNFLMHEENASGTILPHMDWQTIHAAGLQLYLFQGDSDGELSSLTFEIKTEEYIQEEVNAYTYPDCSSFLAIYNDKTLSFGSSLAKMNDIKFEGKKLKKFYYEGDEGLNNAGWYSYSKTVTLQDDNGVNLVVNENYNYRYVCHECVEADSEVIKNTAFKNGVEITTAIIPSKYSILPTVTDCSPTESIVGAFNSNNEALCIVSPCAAVNEYCESVTNYEDDTIFDIQIQQKLNASIVEIDERAQLYNNVDNIYARTLGDFAHFQFIGTSAANFENTEIEALEDKFGLLNYYRSDVYFVVIVLKSDQTNTIFTPFQLKQMAERAVNTAKIENPNKKIALSIINSSDYESILWVTTTDCYSFGYYNSDNLSGTSQDYISDRGIFDTVLEFFKNIEKPVIARQFFMKADGSVIDVVIANKNGDDYVMTTGYDAIHVYQIFESIKKQEIRDKRALLTSVTMTLIGIENPNAQEIDTYITESTLLRTDIANLYSLAPFYENVEDVAQWATNLNINDLGKLRETYMTNREIGAAYFSSKTANFGYGQKFSIVFNFNGSLDNTLHFYDFDAYQVIDPIAYGIADVLSLVPIPYFDSVGDGIGLLYATARGDMTQAPFFAAALALPVGAAYLKAGNGVIDNVFIVTAKKLEDGSIELFRKAANDIPAGHVVITPPLSTSATKADDFKNLLDNTETKELIAKQFDDALQIANSFFDFLPTPSAANGWTDELIDIFKVEYNNGSSAYKAIFEAATNAEKLKYADSWKSLKETFPNRTFCN